MHGGKKQRREDNAHRCAHLLPHPFIEQPPEKELFHKRSDKAADKEKGYPSVKRLWLEQQTQQPFFHEDPRNKVGDKNRGAKGRSSTEPDDKLLGKRGRYQAAEPV